MPPSINYAGRKWSYVGFDGTEWHYFDGTDHLYYNGHQYFIVKSKK